VNEYEEIFARSRIYGDFEFDHLKIKKDKSSNSNTKIKERFQILIQTGKENQGRFHFQAYHQ
jgi:hypothetical protein